MVPLFDWNVPLVCLTFLKRSLVFLSLWFSFISLHWMLRKAMFSLLALPQNSAFRWIYLSFSPLLFTSLLHSAIWKAFSDHHLPFLQFFLGMVFITSSHTMLQTSVCSSKHISHLVTWEMQRASQQSPSQQQVVGLLLTPYLIPGLTHYSLLLMSSFYLILQPLPPQLGYHSRFDAWDRVLGAAALGWPRGMEWAMRLKGGSEWGTHVLPLQHHYNIVN